MLDVSYERIDLWHEYALLLSYFFTLLSFLLSFFERLHHRRTYDKYISDSFYRVEKSCEYDATTGTNEDNQ